MDTGFRRRTLVSGWIRVADPSRWLALRRALYSPRRAVTGHGDVVPSLGSGVHA